MKNAMRAGFIGLGNVGAKLAGSLLRNGVELTVLDLDEEKVRRFVACGATSATTPQELMRASDVVITCLPSPQASAWVVEGNDGLLSGMASGKMWLEMSTTDAKEVKRLGKAVAQAGGCAADCPVSGGCHRADTGNISIFAGCERAVFERALTLLERMGRRILHTGELGSASQLKVLTNYLATANLVSCSEALVAAAAANLDLNVTYEAIRISSGTSFVHETESQVILNGSRDIGFTMGLVLKDIGLFQQLAEEHGVPLELSPLLIDVFKDGISRYGDRERSPNIIRRLEEAIGKIVRAPGFPPAITDDEPEEVGYEVAVRQ